MRHNHLSHLILLAILSLGCGCQNSSLDIIEIDGNSIGDKIPPSLYGVFFEEITHAGDGGLYAEMVQNRGFEDGTLPSGAILKDGFACAPAKHCYSNDSINLFKIKWDEDKAMNAWEVHTADGSIAQYKVITNSPLDKATPHSLYIKLQDHQSQISVVNRGYWGMSVENGKKYILSFWLKSSFSAPEKVIVSLKSDKGELSAYEETKIKNNGKWNKYQTILKPEKTGNDYNLYMDFANKGEIYLDHVSLFPEETFNNRENGLRNDIANYLAELKPAFIRWPGGCIVEGLTMENRVDWKKTIGDPMKRPGEYNLWGYRSTYGFGYHEFLQYCEDINSDAMFVCNAGMSCLFRNGDYVEGKDLDAIIQDALDAIEYAIGDVNTKWGAERAKNGHPAAFPLKYVEIGNENVGPRYAEHYKLFYKAIKEKYPQLTLICALMFHPEIKQAGTLEVIDPHYYETADWFYRNSNLYDNIPPMYTSDIYIGEYAAIGNPSIYSSLAEAAFLTGVERNADRVRYVSYAPLFQNAHHGKEHLIIYNNETVYGRTNYHILKMFSENRPDFNLGTKVNIAIAPEQEHPVGQVGLGSCGSVVSYKDFKIEKGGEVLYQSDNFEDFEKNWKVSNGDWNVKNGMLTHNLSDRDGYIWLDNRQFDNCTISLKAMKHSGREAFRVFFGAQGESDFFMADLGSHQNESVIFGERKNGVSTSLFDYRNTTSIRTGEWYDIRIEIQDNNWKCYLNGDLSYEYSYAPLYRRYAISGYDSENKELVVKLVNGEQEKWKSMIKLDNVVNVGGTAKRITLATDSANAENSFDDPEKIVPHEDSITGVGKSFKMVCPANSFTIVRISCELL